MTLHFFRSARLEDHAGASPCFWSGASRIANTHRISADQRAVVPAFVRYV
jgi:hypothetical protein